jgi:hypothetical protein
MAEKRTKADKAQRQADQLEKKARHPAPKKEKGFREDLSQATTQIVRGAHQGFKQQTPSAEEARVCQRRNILAEANSLTPAMNLVKAQGFPALNKADATAPTCIFTVTVCSSPKLIVVTSFEDCRMKVTRSGLT